MNGDALAALEATTNELNAAVNTLLFYSRNVSSGTNGSNGANGANGANNDISNDDGSGADLASAIVRFKNDAPRPTVPQDAPQEAVRARLAICEHLTRLQVLMLEPSDFLRQLAKQNQLLGCIHWLEEFQVLSCIPLSGSVLIKEIAQLSGVPESTLARVVRMTATAGLLCEPKPGYVAHSPLSAPFVTTRSLPDAAMFLCETLAPTALHMAAATKQFGDSLKPNETAYNLSFDTSVTFANNYKQRSKLQRGWPAYLRHVMGDNDANILDVLRGLEWRDLHNPCVVLVNAQSPTVAIALADLHPGLRIHVQLAQPIGARLSQHRGMSSASPVERRSSSIETLTKQIPQRLNPRISIQARERSHEQPVHDASLYVLHMPSPSPAESWHDLSGLMVADLQAHMEIVRANHSSVALVVTTTLLPESGMVRPNVEATACLRDLSLFQLANDGEASIAEIISMISSVKDQVGGLVVVNKRYSESSSIVALEVCYRLNTRS